MSRAEARYRATIESWGKVAAAFGLEHQILVPPPAEDWAGRLIQVVSGQAQGITTTGADRVAHRLRGRIDDLGVVVEIRREVRDFGGNPTVHLVTRYRAEAAWLPRGVRVANRNHRRALKRANGGTSGWDRLHLPRATHLACLAHDRQRAAKWLDESRVGVLQEAMTAEPHLLLVDRAVRAVTKGQESEAAQLSATLRAVTNLALALRSDLGR